MQKANQLLNLLEGFERVLITSHGNPDPDSLASSLGLQKLVHHFHPQKQVILGYSGIIGRVENKKLVSECNIPLVPLDQISHPEEMAILMVDCQFVQKNHLLSVVPLAVIDHHPPLQKPLNFHPPFEDIRAEYGATSTIVYSYLRELDVPIDPLLATALLYGIKTDTMELARSTLDLEYQAYTHLMTLADREKLIQIIHAPVSPVYYLTFKEALEEAFLLDKNILVAPIGDMESPDVPSQIAEFFVRLEGLSWVVTMGFWQSALYLSVRCSKANLNAGQMIRQVLVDLGQAGGHGMAAGGKIPLLDPTEEGKSNLKDQVIERLAHHFGLSVEKDIRPLI